MLGACAAAAADNLRAGVEPALRAFAEARRGRIAAAKTIWAQALASAYYAAVHAPTRPLAAADCRPAPGQQPHPKPVDVCGLPAGPEVDSTPCCQVIRIGTPFGPLHRARASALSCYACEGDPAPLLA